MPITFNCQDCNCVGIRFNCRCFGLDLDTGSPGNDFSAIFDEGDPLIFLAPAPEIVGSDDLDEITVRILGDVDPPNELFKFGSVAAERLDQDWDVGDTFGSTTFFAEYFEGTGILTITKDGGGTMPVADVLLMLASLGYQHTGSGSVTGGLRTFIFSADGATASARITVVPIVVVTRTYSDSYSSSYG